MTDSTPASFIPSEGNPSDMENQNGTSTIHTQASAVLSPHDFGQKRKTQRRRGILQDITRVTSNLESRFTSGSSSACRNINAVTFSEEKKVFQQPLDQVFKRKSARLKGLVCNAEPEKPIPKSQCQQVVNITSSSRLNLLPSKQPDTRKQLKLLSANQKREIYHYTDIIEESYNLVEQQTSLPSSENPCTFNWSLEYSHKNFQAPGEHDSSHESVQLKRQLSKNDRAKSKGQKRCNNGAKKCGFFTAESICFNNFSALGTTDGLPYYRDDFLPSCNTEDTIPCLLRHTNPPTYTVDGQHYRHVQINLDYNNDEFQRDLSSSDDDESYERDMLTANQNNPTNYLTNVVAFDRGELQVYIDEGDPTYTCKYCHASFWSNERAKKDNKKRSPNSFHMCCLNGKVVLPYMKPPPPLLQRLFLNKNIPESRNFYANIRQYNNMFSFTSMGGKIDHSKNTGGGPYCFVLSGQNHHSLGSLLPSEGSRPVYSQLYIFDTDNEVRNRIDAVSQHQKDSTIDTKIVNDIKEMLDEVNPYVRQYRFASDLLKNNQSTELRLCLISTRQHDGRNYNTPTASEVAALILGDIDMEFNVRDIIVREHSGFPQRIHELLPCYLPLQYPILFPYGEDGYRDDIYHREDTLSTTKKRKRSSMREFFAYRLMHRDNEMSTLLHSSRLLQQFIVDGYTMIEAQRLIWIRTHQKELRADLYQGLSEAVMRGETNATSTGKRIILPSTFTGGARYMLQNYQDAMAICRWAGYPDIFLTFTCNPAWPEITRYCKDHSVNASDRPDILSRFFKLKLQSLMKVIKEKKVFGAVRAEVYTIEFQKRGLPHAHLLLFLERSEKIVTSEAIDKVITAEIPDKDTSPRLYELVKKFMIHGPCGGSNHKSPCMKNNKCSKHFPKKFNQNTIVDEEGYPTYRKRDDGRVIEVKGIPLDNRFVVPYNPLLLAMFEAHINVKKCNQSTAIKYLFKYISKGNDRVVAGIFDKNGNGNGETIVDEIQQYYNFRYLSACEAAWRIFGFDIHHRFPSVERLSFHLPNQQYVIYKNTDDVSELLDNPRVCESQFLSWMKINDEDTFAAELTYAEFPQHYVYQRNERKWKRRQKGFAVGRIANATPSSGELYYLRILLTKVRGPRSFDDIKTVDGVIYNSFKEACNALGLLDDDKEYINAIEEASTWATGTSLRKLFVTMLLCSCLQHPDSVWNKCSKVLSEDLLYIPHDHANYSHFSVSPYDKEQVALKEIDLMLRNNGKSLNDYPSLPTPEEISSVDVTNNLILQELSYDRNAMQSEARTFQNSLTDEQKIIFDQVMMSTHSSTGGFFFVHGYGGTGKTFLWKALTCTLRGKGDIVLAVASSGIAATLLPSGRTAHSRFAIPIQITEFSMCSIRQNSALANLIISTKLIIWDEAPMVQRYCIEAFDRTLKDIMHSTLPFGGKCIVMGGDFRQILPVIPKGSRASIVNACISSSCLWDHCKIFHLTKNMRLTTGSSNNDINQLQWFSQWLLDVGDGKIGDSHDGIYHIEIPDRFLVPESQNPIETIIQATYTNLVDNISNNEYFNDRAILAPTIEAVNKINEYMCAILPGDSQDFFSSDSICQSTDDSDSFDNLYTTEFLNTIASSGLPPHKLTLKVGAPIMLLRNIDQGSGLCNGTRLRISKLGKNVIEAITLNGSNLNQKVLIHRMDMNPSESRWPFHMRRRQFPINLSFAMTINKSQGQSLRHVGIYLSKPVFTHGQLYVALSRVRSMDGLKLYVPTNANDNSRTTINVVYKEVFRNLHH